MFTTQCFIRKNTPELRKKLEELGYNRHPSYGDNGQYLYLNRGFYHTNVVGYSEEIERMIDCGTNEELFLALASLRNDTNEHQWFISNVDIFTECYNNEWRLYENWCNTFTIEDLNSEISPIRKATVEEIIEHFKNK